MAQTDIPLKHVFKGESYNLNDAIHRVAASAAREAVNEQFKVLTTTLITNGYINSGSALSAISSGQTFVTSSSSFTAADSGPGTMILCVKK
jgi:hypothetical protein